MFRILFCFVFGGGGFLARFVVSLAVADGVARVALDAPTGEIDARAPPARLGVVLLPRPKAHIFYALHFPAGTTPHLTSRGDSSPRLSA